LPSNEEHDGQQSESAGEFTAANYLPVFARFLPASRCCLLIAIRSRHFPSVLVSQVHHFFGRADGKLKSTFENSRPHRDSADEQRVARFAARQKINLDISQKEVARRMAAQLSETEKSKVADYVIDNSGSLDKTREQVRQVWKLLQAEADRTH